MIGVGVRTYPDAYSCTNRKYKMNERVKAGRALEQLRFQTGLVGQLTGAPFTGTPSRTGVYEAVVQFDSLKTQLVTHLREGVISSRTMAELIELTNKNEDLVICDYINDEDAERFRESGINYLDNVGNAYLNLPPVYVFIQGKRPKDDFVQEKAARLFIDTGLRVILALLTNDGLLNANYRKIADHAGVSMGTIGWVLRELKNQKFILTSKGKYAWGRRTKLVKKWVESYPSLREKYSLGVYYTQDHDWFSSIELDCYGAWLGGEASVKTALGSGSGAEIFVDKHKERRLIDDLNLIPAQQIDRLSSKPMGKSLARIEIIEKFWGLEVPNDLFRNIVPPLLTYASLMDSWNPQSRELASQVARQFL